MIRILHCGDLHPNNSALFAGRAAIDPITGRNLALSDMQKSLEFCLRTVTKEKRCHLALIGGDVFDSHKPHPNEIRLIRDFLLGLAAAMPVVLIPGNHDMSQNPMDATALEAIKGLVNVFIHETPGSTQLDIGRNIVKVMCLPYPQKGRLLTQDRMLTKSPEEVTAHINRGLEAILRDFTADRAHGSDAINLLMAHGTCGNATVGEQPRTIEHDILIPRETFDRYGYVALNHIHRPQAVQPNAHYSGSLVCSGFGEEKEAKGFKLVEIVNAKLSVEHVPNPHSRTYRTLTLADMAQPWASGLAPDRVWRFKDRLTDQQYEELKPRLDAFSRETPWFQLDVERVEETRARDAGMTGVLTSEDALTRALQTLADTEQVSAAEIPALLEKHRAIEQELKA